MIFASPKVEKAFYYLSSTRRWPTNAYWKIAVILFNLFVWIINHNAILHNRPNGNFEVNNKGRVILLQVLDLLRKEGIISYLHMFVLIVYVNKIIHIR